MSCGTAPSGTSARLPTPSDLFLPIPTMAPSEPSRLSAVSNLPAPGPDQPPADTSRPARVGLAVLAAGFGGFLLWAALAPLDEGVPTPGQVAIDTKRKVVQHQVGGIVREVRVREGQAVEAGQVLIRLDDAAARANFETARQRYLALRAMEGRLLAEQGGQPRIAFHPDLLAAAGDLLVKEHMANQEQLFQSRRLALQAELQAMAASMQGQEAAIEGFQGQLAGRRRQLDLLQEEVAGIRDLVKDGYAPRVRQMELERNIAEAQGAVAELQGNSQRARNTIAELKMRSLQRQQEYRKEVDTQLADVRREVEADGEKFRAAGEELARTEIRSPAGGQVVGLAVQTVNGVIQPGQTLMDIVPADADLLLETKVAPHLIDRVRAGQKADVRFSAFAHSPQLVVEGRVESISGDLVTEPQTRLQYYLARVSVTPAGLRDLGDRRLQAGMPVEAVIKTGERTLLTYLLHPLVKRLAAAMKEE